MHSCQFTQILQYHSNLAVDSWLNLLKSPLCALFSEIAKACCPLDSYLQFSAQDYFFLRLQNVIRRNCSLLKTKTKNCFTYKNRPSLFVRCTNKNFWLMSCFFSPKYVYTPLLPTLQQEMFVTLPPIPKRHPQHAVTYNELLWKFSLYSIFTWSLWKITSPELPFCTQKLTNMYNSPFLSQILKLSVCGHATGSITLVFFSFFFPFLPPLCLFCQNGVRTVRLSCFLTPTPLRMPSQTLLAHKTAATNSPPGKQAHRHQRVQPQ